MATHAWFVSDIHISDMNDPKARKFLAFLSSLKADRLCSHLFLVGDIFDLWVGDHKYFQQKFEPIIQQLQRLISEGVDVHYFEGNHDLHLRKYFQNQLGLQVHEGPEYFQFAGETVRVEHGDQADPEDKGYLFLRWFLRTPVMRTLAYHLPGRVVSAIGEKASHKSRDYTSTAKAIDEDSAREKLHEHAEKVYSKKPFDLLVFGHVHIRDDYKTKSFRAINLGTWLKEPGVLEFSETKIGWADL